MLTIMGGWGADSLISCPTTEAEPPSKLTSKSSKQKSHIWIDLMSQKDGNCLCTMKKRQAVMIFPEVNYELSLVMENVKRES
jgi:hypothetical protein